jgi:AcrR family transcriptional regulator
VIIVKNKHPNKPLRGRPPAFDRTDVLTKAAKTFWRFGYEGASIADLTAAMGITPQSLYAAFGSKAKLYEETLEWYRLTFSKLSPEVLEKPGILDTLQEWLIDVAKLFSDPSHPPGCMISTAVLGCAVENAPIAKHLTSMRAGMIARIRKRLEQGKLEGELKPDTDADALARFICAVTQGMAVQARDGANETELLAIARLAIEETESKR